MRLLIIGFLVIALGVAGVATYLIRTYVKPPAEEVVATKSIKVLIAKRDIRRGDTLSSGNLAWMDWPEPSLHEKYIAVESENQEKKRMDDFTGSIARQPFATGEPILADKTFKIKRSALMAGMLDPGMRAVALTVAADTSVSGFIYPGDRVDIMLTHDKVRKAIDKTEDSAEQDEEPNVPNEGPTEELIVLLFATETILRDVLVLAIDQAVENPEGKPLPSKTVTLAVTQKQAEILATARAMGRLSMSLRSLASPFNREDTELTSTTDVEVSPMMSNINELLANQEEMRLRAAKAEMEAERLRMEEQARAARKSQRPKEKEFKKTIRGLKKERVCPS